ncbi:MAG: bifunctional glycosyltransferase/class I SAM-dependent methyltransferase [Actinomycetota bacterium]|nr:bifunctional glycosyltransferase/class I SAM-dependent methyltransferase [Actinomycetota bacterium]
MPKIIITMPAYRAADTLAKTVSDIPAGVADELILVDDASPDDTVKVARSLGIKVHVHPENRGYGGNQKTCYTEALREGADVVVLLHPDYQYDPKAVPLLIAPILAGDADMTFGSRFAGLGDPAAGGMPMYRVIGNRITTTIENLFLGSRFTDMHSGLRAYTRECLLSTPFRRYSNDFFFDSQFIVDAVLSGQRVVEVPIPTRYTKESSSISVLRSLKYVTQSLLYAAKQSLRLGRRGKRSPVTSVKIEKGPSLGTGSSVERECILCAGHRQELVYPANVTGEVPIEEFSCTTGALAQHDDIVQCRRCGLVSSVPTLAPEDIVENYSRVVDEAYLQEELARRELFGWILDAMGDYHTPGRRLIEIGSNMGLFLHVARNRGWQARGIEPSKWAVEQGVERYGVDLKQGTVEDLADEPKSADVVVMLDVLEHLSDPLDALKKLRPMLADDGLLVLSTVNLSGLHARLRDGNWPWFIRSHLYYFSEETLHAMLVHAGFKLVEWAIVPRSFHLSYIAHRAGESQGALGRAIKKASEVIDPKLPVGWLGDITFIAARPVDAAG